MTRKDYELIAATVADTLTNQLSDIDKICIWTARVAKTNPRFDRLRFTRAVGDRLKLIQGYKASTDNTQLYSAPISPR